MRGNYMHVETQRRDRFGKVLYDHGRLYGKLQRCAWIASERVAGPVDSPIAPDQARPCGKRRILAPKAFARLINCGLCDDGSPVRLRPQNGGALPAEIPTYRNVRPGTREGAYDFVGNINTRRGDPEEVTVVNWRYITKSKRFALVRLPFLNQQRENAWVFIERKWLPQAGRNGLCDNRNQPVIQPVIDPNDDRDFREQAAVNMGLRQGRGNWAPVCANNRYDGR